MQARKAKGLCFNCDDKWHPGHRCKSAQFLLLLADEETEISPTETYPISSLDCPYPSPPKPLLPSNLLTHPNHTPTDPPHTPTSPINFHLSLYAVTSDPSPHTLRFQASIQPLASFSIPITLSNPELRPSSAYPYNHYPHFLLWRATKPNYIAQVTAWMFNFGGTTHFSHIPLLITHTRGKYGVRCSMAAVCRLWGHLCPIILFHPCNFITKGP